MIPDDIDPNRLCGYSKHYLEVLLRYYTVSKIAKFYNVSFTTMKGRLKSIGLPYTKEEIASYRKQHDTDIN